MKTTKQVLILFLFVCMTNSLFSQGNNLQFSRVLLVNSLQTVPVNKVWKIESALVGSSLHVTDGACTDYSPAANTAFFLVNGNNVYVGMVMAGNTSCTSSIAASIGKLTEFPIWLPAGATVDKGTNIVYLSVIEYNIVP